MCYSRCGIAAVVFLATLMFVSPTAAGEPQVAFVVKGDWVELTITHDDQPVTDAQVRVFTTDGYMFEVGETGKAGRGEFPIPPGTELRVEIKIGERNADPIQLTKIDDYVVPTNVLLSFGLAPCCRVPSRIGVLGVGLPATRDNVSPPMPFWMKVGGAVVFTFLGLYIVWASCRSSSKESS